MTGGYFATRPCCMCNTLFVFNPDKVPSIPVDAEGNVNPDGVKRPICEECMNKINTFRASMGEEPIYVFPGAYQAAEGFPP